MVGHLDIQVGDVVLVSSSLKKLLCTCRANGEVFDMSEFIDTITNVVGDSGTVLFPTYNWDFCKGVPFDYQDTPSQCGALSQAALNHPGFIRTHHPIYSFATWGRDQDYLMSLTNSDSFSSDSPFEYLYKVYAKNLFIGIDYKLAMSPVHYAEQVVGVPWRYPKRFWTYQEAVMYVRNVDLCSETVIDPRMDNSLTDYKQYELNGVYFGLVGLRNILDLMIDDLKFKKYLLVYPKK